MKRNQIAHRMVLIIASITILGGFGATAEAKPQRLTTLQQSGHLIIRRLPNLGNHVVVSVYLDGLPFTSVMYGQTFDGDLPPGHHVLSVLALPTPSYVTPTITTINVQSGDTYSFTAEDNGSGNLVLK